MSTELTIIVPDQAKMLATQDIVFVPGQSLSKTIREHIKNVEKLKGADARERFYEVLRNAVAPAVAALVDQATRAGWLNEVRFNKSDVTANGTLNGFTVRHFKPKAQALKTISQTAFDQMATALRKAGIPEERIEDTIRQAGMELRKPKVREVEQVKEQPALVNS